jgi:hypothetical protein
MTFVFTWPTARLSPCVKVPPPPNVKASVPGIKSLRPSHQFIRVPTLMIIVQLTTFYEAMTLCRAALPWSSSFSCTNWPTRPLCLLSASRRYWPTHALTSVTSGRGS